MMVQLRSVPSAKEAEAELMAVEVAPAVLVPKSVAAAVEQLLLALVASADEDECATLIDAVGSLSSAEPATQSFAVGFEVLLQASPTDFEQFVLVEPEQVLRKAVA